MPSLFKRILNIINYETVNSQHAVVNFEGLRSLSLFLGLGSLLAASVGGGGVLGPTSETGLLGSMPILLGSIVEVGGGVVVGVAL